MVWLYSSAPDVGHLLKSNDRSRLTHIEYECNTNRTSSYGPVRESRLVKRATFLFGDPPKGAFPMKGTQ